MMTRSFSCLQYFQQLTSLIIKKGVVGNLADICGLLNYLPQVKDISICFPTNDSDRVEFSTQANGDIMMQGLESNLSFLTMDAQNSTSAMTATNIPRSRAITYPNIQSMHLHGYKISTLNQRDDMSHFQKFSNLKCLFISFSGNVDAANTFNVMDKTMLNFIRKKIPSYEITMHSVQQADECQYLDLYCNAIKNSSQDSTSDSKKSRLHMLYVDEDESLFDNGRVDFKFEKKRESNVSTMYIHGGFKINIDTRLSKVQSLLGCPNDVVTEVFLK